jgi:hypothetical protein
MPIPNSTPVHKADLSVVFLLDCSSTIESTLCLLLIVIDDLLSVKEHHTYRKCAINSFHDDGNTSKKERR